MPRSLRANVIETKTKTWLKRHDPTYVVKMQLLNKSDDVKEKRKRLSRTRRSGHSATHAVFKKVGVLRDDKDNKYAWNEKYKRLCKNDCEVVRRARDGTLHFMPYENESDLDDDRYDAPILSEYDTKVAENVEKLLNGDEELDKRMKFRKVVITKELDDEDCFWKKLNPSEKKDLLRKLRKHCN